MTLPYRGLSPELFHPETVFWNEKIASGELTQEEMEKLAWLPLAATGLSMAAPVLRGLGSIGSRVGSWFGASGGAGGKTLTNLGNKATTKAHNIRADSLGARTGAAAQLPGNVGTAAWKPMPHAEYAKLPELERLAYDKFVRVARQNPALANRMYADAAAKSQTTSIGAGGAGMTSARAGTPISYEAMNAHPEAQAIINHAGFGKQMAQALPSTLMFTPFMVAPALMGDGGDGLPQDDAQAVKMLQRRAAEEARYKRLMSQAQQHHDKIGMLKSKLTKKADLTSALQPGAPEMQRRDTVMNENSRAADLRRANADFMKWWKGLGETNPDLQRSHINAADIERLLLTRHAPEKFPSAIPSTPGQLRKSLPAYGAPHFEGLTALDDKVKALLDAHGGDPRPVIELLRNEIPNMEHVERAMGEVPKPSPAVEKPAPIIESPKTPPSAGGVHGPMPMPSSVGEGHTPFTARPSTAAPPPSKMNPLAIAGLGAAGGGALALGLPALISALSGSGKKKERF